eukprot:m.101795 g.101795  ORF g.101795 m.101795 type:complete len:567 (+) comp27352_c0_seq1:77-1777(+)
MSSQTIFFAVVASMVAVSTALPAITCIAELDSKCAMEKHDFQKCHECVDYYGKLANCTASEEETFCQEKPQPGEDCDKFLDYECGHERYNKTICLHCVDANSAGARKANCTSAEVEKFCEPPPVPPGEECYHEMEAVCGADRHNETLCVQCIHAHEETLKKVNCSTEEEGRFCQGPPAPPAPNAKCHETLDKYCAPDVKNRTLCMRCAYDHQNETRAADCTAMEIDEFCHVQPGPAPADKCSSELEQYCATAKKEGGRACEQCVVDHESTFKNAGCTATQERSFCGMVPPNPSTNCTTAFRAECGMERANHTLCIRCAEDHASTLEKAGCTKTEIIDMCEAPKPPNASCYETLHADCEKVANNKTACLTCAREHEQSDHCSSEDVDKFCHVTPNPGPPSCFRDLYDHCETDKYNETRCVKCADEIKTSANCTTSEIDEFCHVDPNPGGNCSHLFEEDCGADRHNHTMCIQCLERHNETLKYHHCTMSEGEKFCTGHPTPAPNPSHECWKVMVAACENEEHKGAPCTTCLTAHHNETTAAKCSYTEMSEFCKPAKTPTFWEMITSIF